MQTATPETDAIIATLRSELHAEPDIVAAYLYGSVARGTQRFDSDVDVALLLDSDPPDTLESLRLDLAARIEEKTGQPVQIVILNRTPCDLAHRVRRDGQLLIDRAPRRRIAWEVKSRNEYFDMEPIRRLYRHGPSSWTDAKFTAKKLAEIETYLADLRRLGRPDLLETNLKEQRFLLMTLQLAIQAVLDAASHIVSDEKLGEPQHNRDLFQLLHAAGWINEDLARRLQHMVGFRNILVHEYARTNLAIVRDVLENRVDDLADFSQAVARRLSSEPRPGSIE